PRAFVQSPPAEPAAISKLKLETHNRKPDRTIALPTRPPSRHLAGRNIPPAPRQPFPRGFRADTDRGETAAAVRRCIRGAGQTLANARGQSPRDRARCL